MSHESAMEDMASSAVANSLRGAGDGNDDVGSDGSGSDASILTPTISSHQDLIDP